VAIPWPNATVASLHLPHLPNCGVPTSWISNSKFDIIPIV